jgi:hypothetical protein
MRKHGSAFVRIKVDYLFCFKFWVKEAKTIVDVGLIAAIVVWRERQFEECF